IQGIYGRKNRLKHEEMKWLSQPRRISPLIRTFPSGRKIVITAQDELTLICGGGYIKIKGGNVEIGGPGKLPIKNAGIRKADIGSMQGVMKSFEPSTFDEKFVIRNALTKEPIPGKAYKITMPDGSVVSGITDASGATSLNSSDVIGNMIISLVKAN
ncbi:DUF2345 domain-containing protein, partial [Enterobacter hormaechei]|nr:DUF2345 domain-containing protein [Enterobacter hormaechei]MEA3928287.1 DUF2345 domain-containing protein [Enterobacter hormaechei]MEA3935259.1 DUF2345 domain-containing protein [Enterobacter hormaechei]MEA4140486.1 DUF2345 domain-containing protein [Enterobacter hormaechei]